MERQKVNVTYFLFLLRRELTSTRQQRSKKPTKDSVGAYEDTWINVAVRRSRNVFAAKFGGVAIGPLGMYEINPSSAPPDRKKDDKAI